MQFFAVLTNWILKVHFFLNKYSFLNNMVIKVISKATVEADMSVTSW